MAALFDGQEPQHSPPGLRPVRLHRLHPVISGVDHPMRLAQAFAERGEIIFFVDRQGVHVGSQANGAAAGCLAQHANDAGSRQPAMHFESIRRQFPGNDIGGPVLVEMRKFGCACNHAGWPQSRIGTAGRAGSWSRPKAEQIV